VTPPAAVVVTPAPPGGVVEPAPGTPLICPNVNPTDPRRC